MTYTAEQLRLAIAAMKAGEPMHHSKVIELATFCADLLDRLARIDAAQTNQDDSLDRWIARAEKAEAELARLKDEREGNTRQFRRLQDRLAQSEADASSLAAGQCIVTDGGLMGDDHGHLYCDMQRQRDELRGRIRTMADIMNSALDVMKTVEGDGSDEDEALMHIRARMASCIDYVLRRDYPEGK